MVPLSLLSLVRHDVIEKLRLACQNSGKPQRVSESSFVQNRHESLGQLRNVSVAAASPAPTRLRVLVRNMMQLEEALNCDIEEVIADFQDPRDYRSAVDTCRDKGIPIWLTPPRIQKPGEMGLLRQIEKLQPDGVLVRNLAGLSFCIENNLCFDCDYSLNIANEFTAEWLINRGARRVTPSFDLNSDQLLQLAAQLPPEWIEVVLHQHMPMFHMEHCVFCAVLSPGTNKTNCGRPCDTHLVELRDRTGMQHPLKADIGCRNTLYNAQAQSGAELATQLSSLSVRHFRLEFLDETPGELRIAVELYRRLLQGEASGQDVWTALDAMNRVGVTRGSLEARRNPLSIL